MAGWTVKYLVHGRSRPVAYGRLVCVVLLSGLLLTNCFSLLVSRQFPESHQTPLGIRPGTQGFLHHTKVLPTTTEQSVHETLPTNELLVRNLSTTGLIGAHDTNVLSTTTKQTLQEALLAKELELGNKSSIDINSEHFQLPIGIKRIHYKHHNHTITDETSPSQGEAIYQRFVGTEHVDCHVRKRLGNAVDGGWDICTAGPYNPLGDPENRCLVYSFGVGFDFSFEDAAVREFACEVRAFDPSMGVGDHKHNRDVAFFATGLGSQNVVLNDTKWKMRTLGTLLVELGDDERVIDYLKLDIEGWEWDSLRVIIRENVLHRVKQIGLEIHTMEMGKQREATPVSKFKEYIDVLHSLEDAGFRKWYTHYNMYGMYQSKRSGEFLTCCMELVYVNLNFVDPEFQKSGIPPLNVNHSRRLHYNESKHDMIILKKTWNVSRYPQYAELERRTPWTVELTYDHTQHEAEMIFYSWIEEPFISCPLYISVEDDLGDMWYLCTDRPYTLRDPCVVYHISSSNGSRLGDELRVKFKCKVHHLNDRLLPFSLGGKPNSGVQTFLDVLRTNRHIKQPVDVVVLDVSGGEWDLLMSSVTEGSLRYVRQLLVQIHTAETHPGRVSTTSDFVLYWRVLYHVQRAGFWLWSAAPTNSGSYRSVRTKITRPSRVNLHFINVNFLR